MPTILSVDDDAIILKLISAGLTRIGYQVLTASSGAAALQQLTAQHVDCITLDLMMPEMSGTDVLERLCVHESWKYIPVIVVTARGDSLLTMRQLYPQVVALLSKPFTIPAVQQAVQSAIGDLS